MAKKTKTTSTKAPAPATPAATPATLVKRTGLPFEATLPGCYEAMPETDTHPRMIFVPGGEYRMGRSLFPDEETAQQAWVKIDDMMVGQTIVTNSMWNAVLALMGEPVPDTAEKDLLRPKVNVSWVDSLHWLNKLSKVNGFKEPYTVKELNGASELEVTMDWDPNDPQRGFRLPYVEEAEYFTKAGNQDPNYGRLDEIAIWSGGKFKFEEAQPVGMRRPNPAGLYDVTGNVWELTFTIDGVEGHKSKKVMKEPPQDQSLAWDQAQHARYVAVFGEREFWPSWWLAVDDPEHVKVILGSPERREEVTRALFFVLPTKNTETIRQVINMADAGVSVFRDIWDLYEVYDDEKKGMPETKWAWETEPSVTVKGPVEMSPWLGEVRAIQPRWIGILASFKLPKKVVDKITSSLEIQRAIITCADSPDGLKDIVRQLSED